MDNPIGVLVVDQFLKGDRALEAKVEHSPAFRLISECDLDREEPQTKVALVSVLDPHVDTARSYIAHLRRRYPTLRVLVAFQALKGVDLHSLLDAGADAFLGHVASADVIGEALTTLATDACLPDDRQAPPVSDAENTLGLTAREIQVVRLVAGGLTNKQVARMLDLSPRTVEVYRYNVSRKTQAKGRKGFIQLARQLGLETVTHFHSPGGMSFPGAG